MRIYRASIQDRPYVPLTEVSECDLAAALTARADHSDGGFGLPLDDFLEQIRIVLSLKQQGLLP